MKLWPQSWLSDVPGLLAKGGQEEKNSFVKKAETMAAEEVKLAKRKIIQSFKKASFWSFLFRVDSTYISSDAKGSVKVFDLALKTIDQNDDYYSTGGSFFGFGFLIYIPDNNEKNLIRCWALDEALPLNIIEEFEASYVFGIQVG